MVEFMNLEFATEGKYFASSVLFCLFNAKDNKNKVSIIIRVHFYVYLCGSVNYLVLKVEYLLIYNFS